MALHNTWVVLMLVLSLRGQVQTGEIIGGREAAAHSRPYMVLLKLRTKNEELKYCDGFLINDEFVVTAAHCKARVYYMYVGLHELINAQTTNIQVSRAIPHEHFDEITGINDLMLLQLSEKVKFTKNVRPINLASRGDHLPQHCSVSGWGFSETSNDMASKLREVNVTLQTLQNDSNCSEPHAFFTRGEIGPSHGDSGGPLVCEGEVAYGVVSRIKPCPPYTYKVFLKIPDYLGWIEGHMRKK